MNPPVSNSSATAVQMRKASRRPSVPMPDRIFKADMFPGNGKINSYSKFDVLIDVVDILHGTPEYEIVRNSCFGKLLVLSARRCSLAGKLIHNFLCRQLQCDDISQLWFTYAGQPLRFSITEFEHVTGLPYGPFPSKHAVSEALAYGEAKAPHWYTLIGPNRLTTIEEIVALLKTDKEMAGWRRLQLVLVLIVDGLLVCATQPLRPTDEVVEMVKDTNFFLNHYPWGRCSFNLTIEMVKVGLKVESKSDLVAKLKQSSLVLHGFPIAIELFLFESLPSIVSLLPHPHDMRPFTARPFRRLNKIRCYHTGSIFSCENEPGVTVLNICDISKGDVSDVRFKRVADLARCGHIFTHADWSGGDSSLTRLCICHRKKLKAHCRCGGALEQTSKLRNDKHKARGKTITVPCNRCADLDKALAALTSKIHKESLEFKVDILKEVRCLIANSVHGSKFYTGVNNQDFSTCFGTDTSRSPLQLDYTDECCVQTEPEVCGVEIRSATTNYSPPARHKGLKCIHHHQPTDIDVPRSNKTPPARKGQLHHHSQADEYANLSIIYGLLSLSKVQEHEHAFTSDDANPSS